MRASDLITEGRALGEYVYHASFAGPEGSKKAQLFRSLLQRGLKPSQEGYAGPGVYFAYEPDEGYYHVSPDDSVILRARWQDLTQLYGVYPSQKDGIQRDENEIVVPGSVPAQHLEVEYFPGEWWSLQDALGAETGWKKKLSENENSLMPFRIFEYSEQLSEASGYSPKGKKTVAVKFKITKGKNKFSTSLSVNNKPAGIYQYDAKTGRSLAEIYPEFRGQGLGKLLVLHAIYTAAKLGLDFQEDESRTAAYDQVLDSLSNRGYVVGDEGYWYVTDSGEKYLKRTLKESSGYIPSESERNDPRFETALTVDIDPNSLQKNARAFGSRVSRSGRPPLLRPRR